MKTKLIIFDFDGTLSKPNKLPNSWTRIWAKIDRKEDDDRLYGQYIGGEIDYNEWAIEVLKIYREAGVNRKLLEEIAKDTLLLDDSDEVLKSLYEKGIKTIILSGGIKNIINFVLGKSEKYIYKIEAQEILFDSDGVVNGITKLNHFIEDKSQYVSMIIDELNLDPSEVVFFGNSENDETVYKTGVKTICINPQGANYKDSTIWNKVIKNCKSLKELLPFIEENDKNI